MIYRKYIIKNTFMGRFAYNSDLLKELNKFCIEHHILSGQVSVIGAVKKLSLSYYIQDEKKYITLDKSDKFCDRALEIVSCSGNISIKDGNPFAHVHIVASDSEGNAFGGHLMPDTIIFAGEFIIHSFDGENLIRDIDEETKSPLWQN